MLHVFYGFCFKFRFIEKYFEAALTSSCCMSASEKVLRQVSDLGLLSASSFRMNSTSVLDRLQKGLDLPTKMESTAAFLSHLVAPHPSTPRSHGGLSSLLECDFHRKLALNILSHIICGSRSQLSLQFQ